MCDSFIAICSMRKRQHRWRLDSVQWKRTIHCLYVIWSVCETAFLHTQWHSHYSWRHSYRANRLSCLHIIRSNWATIQNIGQSFKFQFSRASVFFSIVHGHQIRRSHFSLTLTFAGCKTQKRNTHFVWHCIYDCHRKLLLGRWIRDVSHCCDWKQWVQNEEFHIRTRWIGWISRRTIVQWICFVFWSKQCRCCSTIHHR